MSWLGRQGSSRFKTRQSHFVHTSQVWCHTPVIPALKEERAGGYLCEFEVSLGHKTSPGQPNLQRETVLKKSKTKIFCSYTRSKQARKQKKGSGARLYNLRAYH